MHGELWYAKATRPIDEGMRVKVIGVDNLVLEVEPENGGQSARGQRTEDGRQRTEDRGQRPEDGGRKTEDRTTERSVGSKE